MDAITSIKGAVSRAGGASSMAVALGVSPAAVSQWVTGHRSTPPDRCPDIERAFGVACEELRPDVRWARVADPDWPHPLGRPCIDVAAEKVAA